jgi:hypothetical protein
MISFSQLGQWGRLGNQLFEVAATIGLAIEHGEQYVFPHWEYENKCSLKGCYSNNIKFQNIYKEPFFHYQKIKYQPGTDLRGYFQSYKYFQHCQYTILDYLTPTQDVKQLDGVCGIHVRRGDYLSLHGCYEILDLNYYQKAMDEIKAEKYLIFSDDIEYCKKIFIGDKFIFSENSDVYNDLSLMSKACEHLIIANSSLSWWGAYLNNNFNKKIICPAKWFGPKLQHNTKDLLPESWIKV